MSEAKHVFISHPRDGGPGQRWAERIEARLRESGVPCWRDVSGVEPDQAWSRRIPESIDRAAVLVCVVSRSVTERDYAGDLRRELDTLTIRPLDPPRVQGFVTRYLTALDPAGGAERADPRTSSSPSPATTPWRS